MEGIIKSDPSKYARRCEGNQVTLSALPAHNRAAYDYWLRLRRPEDNWLFIVGAGALEAWRPYVVENPGAGEAFTWDFVELRWKQIT